MTDYSGCVEKKQHGTGHFLGSRNERGINDILFGVCKENNMVQATSLAQGMNEK